MKKVVCLASLVLFIGLVACKKDEDPTSPQINHTITGFSPSSGPVGTVVTIKGTNLTNINASAAVGPATATITGVNSAGTELYITISNSASTGKIAVTINGGEVKSSSEFTVTEETSIELAETSLEMNTLENLEFPDITNLEGFGNDPDISFSSDRTDVVEVDETGHMIALKAGEAEITITIGELNATVMVTVKPSIFVGGYIEKNDGDYAVATVWINGLAHELSDTSSYDTYVAVSGPNLYATHVEYSLDDTVPIKVYKNNTLFGTVGNEDENNRAPKAIQVVGDDVYICGFEKTNGTQYAKYWKNGEEILLSDEGEPASAQDLFVQNNNVYIAGRGYGNTHIARYWVNGTPTDLTDGSSSSNTFDLFVDEVGDIYTAGSEGTISVAKIWKNDQVLYELSDGNNSFAAQSVVVHEGNVYASGVDWSTNTGKFWVNGQMVHEWPGSGGVMTIYNGSIFLATSLYNANLDKHIATVWELSSNGAILEETLLPNTLESTYASSIIVK